jgi:tight adherence protein B
MSFIITILPVVLVGLVILVAGGLVLIGVTNALVASDDVRERVDAYAITGEEAARRERNRPVPGFNRFRVRLNSMLSFFISDELSIQLLSANWPITEIEFVLIRFWLTVAGFALGWLISKSVLPGIGAAVLLFMIPTVFLRYSINQRQVRFTKQMVDVLVLISGSVRAGYSLLQALDVVVREMPSPAAEEFRRVRREVSLGLPLSQALLNLTSRMQNEDLYLVVTAININQEVGGNLVVMLEAVTQTIRDRMRLFGEIRVLTSQQRFNAFLLTFMPFGLGAVMFILNPGYMSQLFMPGVYLCIPIGAFINIILGNILIRKLSKIDV